MPLWASRPRDFDILNIFYDEFKSEKMAKFETLIVPRGLTLGFMTKKSKSGGGVFNKYIINIF